jgi:hypothetical protein
VRPPYSSISAFLLIILLLGGGWTTHLDLDRSQPESPAFAVTMHAAEVALDVSSSGTAPERSSPLSRLCPTLIPSAAETQYVGQAAKLYILLCTYRI